MIVQVPMDYKKWRQYLEYLRGYTEISSQQLGLQSGLSRSTISYWDTKIYSGISKKGYRAIWQYARAHDAKTYPQYLEVPEVDPFTELEEYYERRRS